MKIRMIGVLAVLLLASTQSAFSQDAYLGVQVTPGENGIQIDIVHPDTAAARGGLQVGDRIVAIDESPVKTTDHLVEALGDKAPGDRTVLQLQRGDQTINAIVTLGARGETVRTPAPPPPPPPPEPPARVPNTDLPSGGGTLGVMLDQDSGAVTISDVLPGGPADRGRIRGGDVIVSIDGRATADLAALREVLGGMSPGDQVSVTIQRNGRDRERSVRLGSAEDLARLMAEQEISEEFEAAEEPDEVEEIEVVEESAQPGFLGVMIEDGEEGGALVAEVMPGGPAQRGRLLAGDRIVAVDDHEVGSADDLREALSAHDAGSRVSLTLRRGDGRVRTRVRLAGPEERERLMAGAEVADARSIGGIVSDSFAEAEVHEHEEHDGEPGWLGVYYEEADGGVRVTDTVDGSPADSAGLRGGDVIVRVGDHDVRSPETLIETLGTLGPGRRVNVHVDRDGDLKRFRVRLGRREESLEEAIEVVEEDDEDYEHGEDGHSHGDGHDHGHSHDDDGHDHGDYNEKITDLGDGRTIITRWGKSGDSKSRDSRSGGRRIRVGAPKDGDASYEVIELKADDFGDSEDVEVINLDDAKVIISKGAGGTMTVHVERPEGKAKADKSKGGRLFGALPKASKTRTLLQGGGGSFTFEIDEDSNGSGGCCCCCCCCCKSGGDSRGKAGSSQSRVLLRKLGGDSPVIWKSTGDGDNAFVIKKKKSSKSTD